MLHHQITTMIEDMVATGRLRGGDQLPTEEDLRAQYGVSRGTHRADIAQIIRTLQMQFDLED